MKKGQILDGKVICGSFPNKGVVETEEGELFRTKNVIPGQTVRCRIKKSSKSKAEGMTLEILEKSPLETKENVCEHFGACGGCSYQSVPYEEQLKLKESMELDLFRPVLGEEKLSAVWEGLIGSPEEDNYRNKMEFTFGDEVKDGPLSLGMHKRGSFYDIVTVSDCRIMDADMRLVLSATLEFFRERNISYYHRLRHEGYLRHLLVRKAKYTGEILVDLVTSTQIEEAEEKALLEAYTEMLKSQKLEGTLRGLLHTRNDQEADAIKDEGTEILYGEDYFYEKLLNLKFKITPFSFFQTNSLGAEVLYDTARRFILDKELEVTDHKARIMEDSEIDSDFLKEKLVYDLYSGTGTIAQMLASVSKEVLGIELVAEAVEAAKENAGLNGLSNCDFLAGDVYKVLSELEGKPDFIVLDPPREGIQPKAIEKILSYDVDSMIYISCKPTSLARDLEIFLARGYDVTRMCAVDMFPATYHCETICLLKKCK
ncbi:MAG: 23S rRNA (uracil(1939)-C(5))-methyltransferase RlmD [Lachnospiraceae bacterium]|nr:23S rRNA (uracil(1939)-C(5))-methyltransferase RlmD [Lachnospiraceae bacterium]MCR5669359.1 23S rRNA (uracil(1939)-C(5))-methyltransferase RlmD [Lachnospiraceae bacterium]